MRTLTLTITEELAGRRVKGLLRYRLHIPEGMIARIKLRSNGICLNGQRCRTTDTVQTGDVLTAEVGDLPEETGIIPALILPDIRYEDEDVLILEKPAGIATHGASNRGDCTVAGTLAAYWGTDRPFHPVTRLDRGTSGLMVVAKNGYTHALLREMLHTDDFIREYLAVAEGVLPDSHGSITLPIKRDEAGKNRFRVSPDGRSARTDYAVLASDGDRSLVRLRLHTGRTHQIRVHLAALGCPLVGDCVYGAAAAEISRPALHSARLQLVQPVTGKHIALESPLPLDMEALLAGLLPETAGTDSEDEMQKKAPAEEKCIVYARADACAADTKANPSRVFRRHSLPQNDA